MTEPRKLTLTETVHDTFKQSRTLIALRAARVATAGRLWMPRIGASVDQNLVACCDVLQ